MKIRFIDGELKNRIFDIIKINKDKTIADVWNKNFHKKNRFKR